MNSAIQIARERLIKTITVILIVTICVVLLLKVNNMLVSFIMAFIINYLFSPLAATIERTGVKRGLAVSLIYSFFGSIFVCLVIMLLPAISHQFSSIKYEFPGYIEGATHLTANFEKDLNAFVPGMITFDLSKTAETAMKSFSMRIFEGLPGLFSVLLQTMILAPLFAFFMMLDGQRAIKNLLAIVPNNLFESALNLQYQINLQIGGFVRARLLEAAIVGAVVWACLLAIHFPYALFFAIFAGITNLIPYIGPVIGAIPAILLAVIKGFPGLEIVYVAGAFGVAQLIDTIFIVPMVVARIVDLHAVIVIIVVIIGAQLAGIPGMIISIPVASILKLTAISVYQHLIYRHA